MTYSYFFFPVQQQIKIVSLLRFGLLIISFIWNPTALLAQTTTWTGAVDTGWGTPGNWSAGLPTTALDAVIPSTPANQPVLSTTAVAKSVEVQSGSSLSITATGSLTISGSKNVNGSSAAFFNSGMVTSNGKLVISSTTLAGSYGLWNLDTFTNNAGGVIIIDGTDSSSLLNQNGSFTNAAQITIGSNAHGGNSGIRNEASFTNTTGGVIAIDRTRSYGLHNFSGNFINEARITIGAEITKQVGECGLLNRAIFMNNLGSIITINRALYSYLTNQNGTFINAAQINIGSTATQGFYGLINYSRFNNIGCEALLNVVDDAIITNQYIGYLTNSGTIIENSSEDSDITTNSGLVRNLKGGNFAIRSNTGILTTTPGGAGASITASPSLTITQGQSTTLTASGATSYTWSTGETTPTISVSVAGTYSVTGTLGSCISTTSVTTTLTPDLALILYARPTTLYNTTDVNVVVDVVELTGLPTSGPLTVHLTKDARLNLIYPPTATQINNRSVQNNSWTLSNSFSGYYTLTTNQPVAGGDKLSFGFIGSLVPGATTGSVTVSAVVFGGSESRVSNNTDSDKVDYFQQ